MQLFVLTAALFAGLTYSQDLSQIQNLPGCGVCDSPPRYIESIASWPFADMEVANMHQQHVGQGPELGMPNLRLRVSLRQHELRLWRPRLFNSCVRGSQSTCRPEQHHLSRKQFLRPFVLSSPSQSKASTDHTSQK